jgi:Cu+-exporting ATPase
MNTHSHHDPHPRPPVSIDPPADVHSATDSCCARSASDDAKAGPASTMASHSASAAAGSCCAKPAQTSSSDVLDPVCGMQVDPVTAKHRAEHDGHTYYFCSGRCREKFVAAPARYLEKDAASIAPAPEGTLYTCPMHPEVQQVGPGSCPKCGMALEPIPPQ